MEILDLGIDDFDEYTNFLFLREIKKEHAEISSKTSIKTVDSPRVNILGPPRETLYLSRHCLRSGSGQREPKDYYLMLVYHGATDTLYIMR